MKPLYNIGDQVLTLAPAKDNTRYTGYWVNLSLNAVYTDDMLENYEGQIVTIASFEYIDNIIDPYVKVPHFRYQMKEIPYYWIEEWLCFADKTDVSFQDVVIEGLL